MSLKIEALERTRHDDQINWVTAGFMALFHAGAIAALFFFTWKALIACCVLWWISGSLGIGMGYHRLLTHRGYKTPRWMEYFMTVCGTMALEGGPIAWVATHRMHRTTAACGHTLAGSSPARRCIAIPPSCCRMFPTCESKSFTCGSANIIGCRWREAARFSTPSADGLA